MFILNLYYIKHILLSLALLLNNNKCIFKVFKIIINVMDTLKQL